MSYLLRIFWLIALLFFVSGCSGYKVVCFPGREGALEAGQEGMETCNIKPGDQVRVILVDGGQAEGIVQIISSSEIVLDAKGKNLQPRGYSMDQVYSIEKGPIGGAPSTNTIVIMGVIALIVGGVILASSLSGISN